jgi:hypothetical protein
MRKFLNFFKKFFKISTPWELFTLILTVGTTPIWLPGLIIFNTLNWFLFKKAEWAEDREINQAQREIDRKRKNASPH